MALAEFDLIRRFFVPLAGDGEGVDLGIGDDCALLRVPEGEQLAVSLDTLVEGTHFPAGTAPEHIASRLMGACLSDLAAMGARPAWITLALTLPNADISWLQPFSATLATLTRRHRLSLVGGDTTRGPLSVSLQVHGFVPTGKAMCRRGARAGDPLYVSGTLGDAMAGLDQIQHQAQADPYLQGRFYAPTPRIETGLAIRPYASAAIDISDGLLADLGHILKASNVGAEIELSLIPHSTAMKSHYNTKRSLNWALSGGEDFELCFAVNAAQHADFEQALCDHPLPLTRIGTITAGDALICLQKGKPTEQRGSTGYQHF